MNKNNSKMSMLFVVLSILFTVCLIASNLFATKQFQFFNYSLPAAVIVFPVSYIINDCVSEVWGFRRASQLIWIGFLLNFFFVAMGSLADVLPPAGYWDGQESFHMIFGLAPRMAFASFVAFLVGSFTNAFVMSKMKVKNKGKHFSLRAILSTIFGEGLDSLIFYPLALGGIVPWEAMPMMMLLQVSFKTIYEILVLPLTIAVVTKVKEVEGEDVYDTAISYNIFKGSQA